MSKYAQLETYFKENYDALVKKIVRRAGSPENAEDVVQEAFFRAMKYWDSYSPEQKLGAWLNTIMVNACRDHLKNDRMLGMTVEISDDQFDPVELPLTDHDTLRQVQKLMRKKSYPQSEIIRLYYFKGYKPIEIKEILDVKHGTVRQTVLRFKEEVQEKLGE